MPLAYWDGRQPVQTSWARSDLGLDAYLVCPGPSMVNAANLDGDMRGLGRLIVGINTSFPGVVPDLWIGMDRPEAYDPSLWRTPFPKICGSEYQMDVYHGIALRDRPGTYFTTGTMGHYGEIFTRRDHNANFLWIKDTFWLALNVIVWMGARRIHLVGCDLGGDRDYYHKLKLTDMQRMGNRAKYEATLGVLPAITAEGAKDYGTEFISCSPDSPINGFLPFVPLAEALEASAKRQAEVYPANEVVLHGERAQLCRWKFPKGKGEGILVGCNTEQEWLLPWWYENYRKHNERPVAFADFGMSAQARAWCEERGEFVRWPHAVIANPYYGKVLAMLSSPFGKTLWMDLDIEVRGTLDEWFADADAERVRVGTDPQSPWRYNANPINSGLLLVPHGVTAIQEWMELLFKTGQSEDQSILNRIWAEHPEHFCLMPPWCNWLRLMGAPPENAVAVHWTGPPGKSEIKRQMKEVEVSDERSLFEVVGCDDDGQ